jgi:cytochrome c peroxidase
VGSASGGVPGTGCADTAPRGVLSDVRWPALRSDGSRFDLTTADLFVRCAATAELVVLRVSAGFCGTCRWLGAHTADMAREHVRLVDVLVANDDGEPATADDLVAWRPWVPGSVVIAADGGFALRAALGATFVLPLTVVIDARTMDVVDVVEGPDTDVIKARIEKALAALENRPAQASRGAELRDGRFPRWEWEMAEAMVLPGAPPPDPSNAHADDGYAATLGEELFSEKGFAKNADVACITCHDPQKARADARPQAFGVSAGDRNTPSIALAAHARSLFWDGRADSLWMQALGPLESPLEIGSSRLRVAHLVHDLYQSEYESIFGALPALADTTRFPLDGGPGSAAWASMSVADQDAATKVFVQVGKAIAAYERTFRVKPSALDRYVTGDASALGELEKDGLHAFFTRGCAQCHYGPRLTDDAFHVVRFATGRVDGAPDRGAIDGFTLLASSPFARAGAFSDAPSPAARRSPSPAPSMLGAFRTPTLRGLPSTAPYGHGGTFATIEDVVAFYARGGPTADEATRTVGALDPLFPPFDAGTAAKLTAFLRVLSQ